MYHNAGLGQRAALGKPALSVGRQEVQSAPAPARHFPGSRQLQRTGQAAAASPARL